MISHIVAASENNIIGVRNGLPWKLSADFKYFKNKTWGMPVIMGRNTFESLKKDLPGRVNIVLTGKEDFKADRVQVAHTIPEAIEMARLTDARELFIIGGGNVFYQTLPFTDRIYLTRVHTTLEGDTSYPVLDTSEWELKSAASNPADEKNNYPYTFEVWERTNKREV